MNEDKATRYHRLGRRAALLSATWVVFVLSVAMFGAGSAALRNWTERLVQGPNAIVALYVLALSTVVDVALLPFSFYRGFVLERRYGLATQTMTHWLKDYLKAAAIGLLFAEAGALFVYVTLREWPATWWMVSAAAYSVVTMGLVNVAPILLLPLFYRFKPLDKAALRERLTALAAKAGTRVMGVYEWTLSDRTRKANAALAGLGHTRRILLSDTLLAEYTDDEIEVILAHELAHHVHRDIWTGIGYDVILTFTGFFAAHRALLVAVPYFELRSASDPAGIPILLVASGALALAVRPAMNAMSRAHERRADAYALEMTKNPAAFISAMRRLGQQNLAEENPSRLVQAFFYTHPPVKERLRTAQNWPAAVL
jgi:STE24 endopeptidase